MRTRLVSAGLCAAAAAAVYVVAVHVAAVREADARTLEGFLGVVRSPAPQLASALMFAFNPVPFAVLTAALLSAAVGAGRGRATVAAGVAIVGAGATSQILKPLLAVPRADADVVAPASWPSGHATAVMSFALALVLLAPARLRTAAATAGGVLTVATVYGTLITGAHYPSDAVGGLLIATGWMCLVADPVPSVAGALNAGLLLVTSAGAVVLLAPAEAAAYAASHTTSVAGALVLAAGALVLTGTARAPTAAHPAPRPR